MKEFNFYRLKVVKEKSVEYQPLTCPEEVAEFFRLMIGDYAEEYLLVAGCDVAGHPVCFFEVSHGDICSSIVDPAAIFRRLLASNCAKFFVCHNHPSGSLEFSDADEAACKKLKKAGRLLNIQLLDSLVVTDSGWISSRNEGIL